MATFGQRMMGAAKLDVRTYEEVEADASALPQAMAVVVLSSIALGLGSIAQRGLVGLVTGTIGDLFAWFIWALLTYLIGTKLLPEPQTSSSIGELLRTIGFAASPGVLRIFGAIPGIGRLILLVISIWMLVAMVVAVRQALDYKSTWRAIGVCLIGWILLLVVAALIYR